MIDLNRIDFSTPKKDTVANYIDDVLSRAPGEEAAPVPAPPEAPAATGGGIAGRVLGKINRSKARRQQLRDELTDKNKPPIDLTPFFALNDADFIRNSINVMFYRNIGPGEYPLLELLKQGVPREAVLYILCASPEMDKKCSVAHFEEYEKAYLHSKVTRRIARLPVINYITALFTAPVRLKNLEKTVALDASDELYRQVNMEAFIQHRIDILYEQIGESINQVGEVRNRQEDMRNGLQQVRQEIGGLGGQIEGVEDSMKAQIDTLYGAHQKMDHITESVDRYHFSQEERIDALQAFVAEKLDNMQAWQAETTRDKAVFSAVPGGVTVVSVGDTRLGVPSEDWRLAATLTYYNHVEPGVEKWLAAYVERGMTVVDVGANVGVMSMIMAKRIGAEGRLYAFEPTQKTYGILVENFKLNGFEAAPNIHTFRQAVSDSAGEVEFRVFDTCGENSMFELPGVEPAGIERVPTVDLDSVLAGEARIDVVKIDVEGAEPLVLAGMKNTIARNPNIKILIEFLPQNIKNAGGTPEQLYRDIVDTGLDIKRLQPFTGEPEDVTFAQLLSVPSSNLLLYRDYTKAR